jgi:hypothetical protein
LPDFCGILHEVALRESPASPVYFYYLFGRQPLYPVLATWEDFNLPEGDGSSVLTVTVALDPRQTQSPRVTGADRGG